jgi:hypothetical protein
MHFFFCYTRLCPDCETIRTNEHIERERCRLAETKLYYEKCNNKFQELGEILYENNYLISNLMSNYTRKQKCIIINDILRIEIGHDKLLLPTLDKLEEKIQNIMDDNNEYVLK